jgi:cohesin complex subunit SCC1
MTLLEARAQGRLADLIFFPPSIHPDLRAMLNPEYLRRALKDSKRKREEGVTGTTPKKARLAENLLEEQGFGDGGFADGGFADGGFGDGGFADSGDTVAFGDGGFPEGDGGFAEPEDGLRRRTISPSLVDEEAQPEEEEEAPTSVTGSMSRSTIAAAQLLQKELSTANTSATLEELTEKSIPGAESVQREDAVRMFFEVLVLASRDVIRVKQSGGFGEIRVQGKEGLFKVGGFSSQQVVV